MGTSSQALQIAVTADLHWGPRHPDGQAATRHLAADLYHHPPDVFVLAGDAGAGEEFAACLKLFEHLPCKKALVPGNHDVWVRPDDPRGDSLAVYREHLPRVAAEHGFHYLDHGPLLLPDAGLAVVGSMNWYDYSWALDRLRAEVPDWENRVRTKRFARGRHNDANFVRWAFDDPGFTREAVGVLAAQVRCALTQVPAAVLMAHHPPFRALNYPKPGPWGLDELLWEAFSGNDRVEGLLAEWGSRVPFAFCGHTHFAREETFGPTRGFNVGGDYDRKRLLRLDWPAGTVTATDY
jgi:3',5'-cyclic AMP phosphodiesterase CpdA